MSSPRVRVMFGGGHPGRVSLSGPRSRRGVARLNPSGPLDTSTDVGRVEGRPRSAAQDVIPDAVGDGRHLGDVGVGGAELFEHAPEVLDHRVDVAVV